ncbi:MAG: glutathione S-transferase family protein [Gammaproteobacteria bacterium]
MRVYGSAGSRSIRVVWTLEELGWEYEYIPVDLIQGTAGGAAYQEVNPAIKVPAVETDGAVLTESAAICTYLADLDPARRLVPAPDTMARARHTQWCLFVCSELEQPLWTLAKHRFVLPEALRVPAVRPAVEYEFDRMLDVLAQGLGNQPFILGDELSVADLLLAHTLGWARKAELPLKHPHVERYADRLLTRPALARAREGKR